MCLKPLKETAIDIILKSGFEAVEMIESEKFKFFREIQDPNLPISHAGPKENFCAVFMPAEPYTCVLIDVFSFRTDDGTVLNKDVILDAFYSSAVNLNFKNSRDIRRFFKNQVFK